MSRAPRRIEVPVWAWPVDRFSSSFTILRLGPHCPPFATLPGNLCMLARACTPAFSSIARSASRYISMKAAGERGGITADERFLFDLNGFLVLRGILSPEEVAAANAAVDAKQSLLQSRDTAALRNTKTGKWPRFEPSTCHRSSSGHRLTSARPCHRLTTRCLRAAP